MQDIRNLQQFLTNADKRHGAVKFIFGQTKEDKICVLDIYLGKEKMQISQQELHSYLTCCHKEDIVGYRRGELAGVNYDDLIEGDLIWIFSFDRSYCIGLSNFNNKVNGQDTLAVCLYVYDNDQLCIHLHLPDYSFDEDYNENVPYQTSKLIDIDK